MKIRGNPHQIFEKYQALARDAHTAGDRVMEENYAQHAEHYYRLANSDGAGGQQQRQQQQQQPRQQQQQPAQPQQSEAIVSIAETAVAETAVAETAVAETAATESADAEKEATVETTQPDMAKEPQPVVE